MRIHYLQHVPFESPGVIETWAKSNDHKLTGTKLFASEVLPAPKNLDALIVMGGPMGVGDEKEYPWLRDEKILIKQCIDQHNKVLGICLGAQLIAEVLGAKVQPMLEKEIGWFPVYWTRQAREHSPLDFLPAEQMVFHWHGDVFYTPENAINLATSKGCENQAFFIDDHVLGLQFHLEMTPEGLSELISSSRNELKEGRFIQERDEILTSDYFSENHQILTKLLDRFF